MGFFVFHANQEWNHDNDSVEELAFDEFSLWSDFELAQALTAAHGPGISITEIRDTRFAAIKEISELFVDTYCELRDRVTSRVHTQTIAGITFHEFHDDDDFLMAFVDLSHIRSLPAHLDHRLRVTTATKPKPSHTLETRGNLNLSSNPNYYEIMRFTAENHPDPQVRASALLDLGVSWDPDDLPALLSQASGETATLILQRMAESAHLDEGALAIPLVYSA